MRAVRPDGSSVTIADVDGPQDDGELIDVSPRAFACLTHLLDAGFSEVKLSPEHGLPEACAISCDNVGCSVAGGFAHTPTAQPEMNATVAGPYDPATACGSVGLAGEEFWWNVARQHRSVPSGFTPDVVHFLPHDGGHAVE